MKKYIVKLSEEEIVSLNAMINKGKAASKKILHARILLKADESEWWEKWIDEKIASAFSITARTVERVRNRFVTEWLDSALTRKVQKNRHRKIDGDIEAQLIKLACSKAPEWRAKWTLRLLADKMGISFFEVLELWKQFFNSKMKEVFIFYSVVLMNKSSDLII